MFIESLTMKVFGEGTGLAFIAAGSLAGVTLSVTAHAGELVVVQVCSWRAVSIACHSTQQCVWIQHKSLLTMGALVGPGAGASHTGLVAFCNSQKSMAYRNIQARD